MRPVLARWWRALAPRLRRTETVVLGAVLALLLGLFFVNDNSAGDTHTPRGDGKYRPLVARGDGHMMWLVARSLVFDRDYVIDNDYARFAHPWGAQKTVTGRAENAYPIGTPLVWAPFLVTAHGVSKVLNVFGADIPGHGYTLFHQRFTLVTSVFFALGACVLGMRAARRATGARWGPLFAAAAVALGTSLTYYAAIMPAYGHAMDAFFVAAFLAWWAATLGRLDARRFVILGVLLGVSALVRVQNLPNGAVLLVEAAVLLVRPPAGSPPRAQLALRYGALGALTLAVALIVFIPQLVAWKLMYGSYFHVHGGPAYVRHTSPLVLELLFANKNGWLSTHPIAFAGALGLLFAPRGARLLAGGLFTVVAAQIYLNATIFDWWGAASFGARRMVSMTFPVVVGLAFLIAFCARHAPRRLSPGWRRALAAAVLLWFMRWNLGEVWALHDGKSAGRGPGAVSYRGVPGWMAAVARPINTRIGNPFALPASLPFALRFGVDLGRWDQLAGRYLVEPPLPELKIQKYHHRSGRLGVGGAGAQPFIARGLGPADGGGPGYRKLTRRCAEVILPVLMPDAHRVQLGLRVTGDGPLDVELRWNGERRGGETLPGPGDRTVSFTTPAGDAGTDLVGVCVTGGGEPGRLAVGVLTLGFVPPAPKPPAPQP